MKIYVLKDQNDAVFYVGKTNDLKARLAQHIKSSFLLATRKDIFIQEMMSLGSKPKIEVVRECDIHLVDIFEEYEINRQLENGAKLLNVCMALKNRPNQLQLQVLTLMAKDKDTKDIAQILNRSPRTIENNRQGLKSIAGVKTSHGLMIWAIDRGYVAI